MTKVVNGTTHKTDDWKAAQPLGALEKIETTIRTLFYDDGRVIEQYGRDEAWVEIKEPDVHVLAVGKCKDCGQMIFEDEEWQFPKTGEHWVRHLIADDCKGKDKNVDDENS